MFFRCIVICESIYPANTDVLPVERSEIRLCSQTRKCCNKKRKKEKKKKEMLDWVILVALHTHTFYLIYRLLSPMAVCVWVLTSFMLFAYCMLSFLFV